MHRIFFSIKNCGRNFGGAEKWLLSINALNNK